LKTEETSSAWRLRERMRASSAKTAVAERVVDPAVVAAAEAVRYGDYLTADRKTGTATQRSTGSAAYQLHPSAVYVATRGILP